MLLAIVLDSEPGRLERVREDEACNITHDLHSVHRQDLGLVVQFIFHNGLVEYLSTNIEKFTRFAIVGKPGLGFLVSSLSSIQTILARLTPTIHLVTHTLVSGGILLDILEALWLANSEQDPLDLIKRVDSRAVEFPQC